MRTAELVNERVRMLKGEKGGQRMGDGLGKHGEMAKLEAVLRAEI